MPGDYAKKAIPVKKKFDHIELFALSSSDVLVSKIARFNDRDEQDIKSCIKKAGLLRKQVKERAEQLGLVAVKEEDFKYHLKLVLGKMF